MNKFMSRKFVVSLLTVVSILVAKVTGVELSDAEVASMAGVVMTYLGGQSFVDGKEAPFTEAKPVVEKEVSNG